jgi:tRNA threonylcarbamoyl adenosine modification protein YeaZ
LLIDSSGARFVCALADDHGVVRDLAAEPGFGSADTAASAPRFETLLTRLIPPGLRSITVGTGPGSFIGTRTAISFANGYASASGLRLYGVNSLAAIAAVQPKPCAVLRDARRGQWYLWTPDGECVAGVAASVVGQLAAKGISEAVLDWSSSEQPEIHGALQSAGISLAQTDAVPAAGLLTLSRAATPQQYVEPVYLRSFL